ncbi:MAG: MaoC family dehydratase [Proteobacteria bacterium]|nr:MaoC family dehydratase [Pseudomonadota bacterium]
MTLLSADTPLGSRLPPVARRFSVEMFAAGGAKTIHNDAEAARREGLPGPVAVGPQVAALIFRMMRTAFAEGWIVGGKASLTFRRPVGANEGAAAHGVVTERRPEGDKVRLTCEVWVETEAGVKAIVGTASGLVPRAQAEPAPD